MNRPSAGFAFILIPTLALSHAGADDGSAFFENKIRPVFAEHCYTCHSAEAKKVKGALRLDTKEDLMKGGTDGAVIVPGDPERSPLIKAVRYDDQDLRMPPEKDGGKKLPDVAIADLIEWVKMGAPFPGISSHLTDAKKSPRLWALDPIRDPPPPPVKDGAWSATSIDRFILAKIEERGLQPAPPADPRTFIRRATFDLTGLPPTPEEVEAFLADSIGNRQLAIANLIDRLLASPAYGERWGRHWLDVVRYADTAGETADYPAPLAWRYRNYVIDAFNADKPYDEFLREQIAGDILARSGPRERYAERATATGYLAISRRFGFDSENYHNLTIQDTIDTLGQSVLGLSLGCARCHDHKFDPVPMRDYYALYGIFDSTRYAFPGSEQKQKSRAMLPLLPPKESRPQWREFDARVATLAGILEKAKQPVPSAILRSLDDLDGDFEMQAAAAGGSNGVLVPPWIYEGKIAVTNAAQSPFKNIYPSGKVGANVSVGADNYRIGQGLHPRRTRENCRALFVNLDFRVAAPDAAAPGSHRFWIGSRADSPAVEVFISSQSVSLRVGENAEVISALKPGQWHNLQLTLDLESRTVSGSAGAPGEVANFSNKPFGPTWNGALDFAALDSRNQTNAVLPALDLDNFAAQDSPIPPVSTALVLESETDLEKVKRELETLLANGPGDIAYGMSEGTPHNARVQVRGEMDRPGDETPRGFLTALGGGPLPPDTKGSGRLELAQWLTRADNPLTARVMVNRIWQYHFGRGLVRTPNDFGVRGQPPTHPELLDHLATQFVKSGWSVKAMHRLIMLSATYRQAAGDSDNYAAFQRRRFSAEELRDAILAISGELDRAPGREHPFPSPLGWGFTQHGPFAAVYDSNKRSVYLMVQRIKRHPFLALFDGADPNTSTPDRRATTVPTQALFFLNDPFVHAKAEKFAARLQPARPDEAQRIELAMHLALGRAPTEIERADAAEFLAAYRTEVVASGKGDAENAALAAYVRTLFGSNEFLHLD